MASDLKFLIEDEVQLGTKIKVVGVGGGGSNAVARMLQEGLGGVEFFVLNTDKQALAASPVANKLALGKKLTSGLGAGADPSMGRQSALEDTEQIIEILEGADMVFVTAGLGGGTGTGAAPVVASLAKELNALTVAVVTKPFSFEGNRRMKQAERGLCELAASCDTVITVPNEKLLALAPRGMSLPQSFRLADDVLRQAVQGIADIITTPGLINRDFSDIRTIMVGMGYAMMGTAIGSGADAAVEAARKAINSPLMDEGGILGARGVLINITGSSNIGIHEVNEACKLIGEATQNNDVQINFGVVVDERMGDDVKITVIATGFQRETLPEIDRRSPHFPFTVTNLPDLPAQEAASPVHAEPEFAAHTPEPEPVIEEMPPVNDYDTPAFLRKQRRLVQ
ncbi:MAG: cell division protein FtsZ [Acidobacteriota bacterium]|nr:cell division protein FtsZ [Acidobacteriota bacterium]